MEMRTFEMYLQVGDCEFKRILGIGKVINLHNLWHWKSYEFNIPYLASIHLNFKPCYNK